MSAADDYKNCQQQFGELINQGPSTLNLEGLVNLEKKVKALAEECQHNVDELEESINYNIGEINTLGIEDREHYDSYQDTVVQQKEEQESYNALIKPCNELSSKIATVLSVMSAIKEHEEAAKKLIESFDLIEKIKRPYLNEVPKKVAALQTKIDVFKKKSQSGADKIGQEIELGIQEINKIDAIEQPEKYDACQDRVVFQKDEQDFHKKTVESCELLVKKLKTALDTFNNNLAKAKTAPKKNPNLGVEKKNPSPKQGLGRRT